MAFQLQKAKFFTVQIPNATGKQGYQGIEFLIARGQSTDTALDISNVAGTFWANAIADATYGSYATKAKAVYAGIEGSINGFVSLEILANTGPMYRVNGAPSGPTEYRLQNGETFPVFGPNITLNSNAAPATIKVVAILDLVDTIVPAEFQ